MTHAPTSARLGRDARSSSGTRSAAGASHDESAGSNYGSPGRPARPLGEPYDEEFDWAQAGSFGAGIVVGALLGAGAMLLLAPQSGAATRRSLRRRARFLREDAHDAWDDLAEQIRHARRSLKRKRRDLRRRIDRRRWAMADAVAGERPNSYGREEDA